jgi:hypothetical protein
VKVRVISRTFYVFQLHKRGLERAFQLQQLTLYFESSAVAAQAAVRSQNAMTWNDDRNWVIVVRHTHRSKPLWTVNTSGDLRVTSSLTVRNLQQRIPTFLLELRTA